MSKRTLRQIADSINKQINWLRIGFDPKEERTNWIVIINGEKFDFFCGLFACIPATKERTNSIYESPALRTYSPLALLEKRLKAQSTTSNQERIFQAIRQGQVTAIKNWNDNNVKQVFLAISNLCEPTAYDFLYCMQSDCRADSQSFNDWCGDCGGNTDSISSLNLYNLCIENAKRLRKALGMELYRELMECEDID